MVPRSTRPSNERTRRKFLQTGALVLLTASTAGCLSSLPPLGPRQAYGRIDVPPADGPAYRRWLPAPSTADSHYVVYGEPAPIAGDEPEEFIARRAFAKTEIDYFGIGFEEYDSFLKTEFGTVIEAEFDTFAIAENLIQSGYEPAGSHRDYAVFSRADVPRRAAIREGTIVWSSALVHDQPDIEALIDTEAGHRRRYHEASPSFERLSDAIGASRLVIIGPEFDPTDTVELAADAFRFADSTVYQVIKLLFPAEHIPTVSQLEAAYRNEYHWTDEADEFDIQLDGNLASLEARVPQERPTDLSPRIDPPHVTWGGSHDPDAETLTLRHEAGAAIDSDLLWYDIDTQSAPGEVEKQPLWPGTRTVEPGDSETIDLSRRTDPIQVNIILSETRGCCDFRVLFTYDLGDRP